MGWAPSLGEEHMLNNTYDVTYINGAYVAEIPAMESPENAVETEVFFGLCEENLLDNNSFARTRATTYRIKPKLDWPAKCKTSNYTVINNYLSPEGDNKIGEAIGKLESLGFKPLGEDTKEPIIIKYNVEIYLVKKQIEALGTSGDRTNLMATIIHETFHWFQAFYDKRYAINVKRGNVISGQHMAGTTMLDESASVWSEKFYSGDFVPELVQSYAPMFLSSAHYYRDLHWKEEDVLDNIGNQRHFNQNLGYGMSSLIMYLCKTKGFGDSFVYKLFEKRYNTDSDPNNTLKIVKETAKERESTLNIFTQKEYIKFAEALCTGQVYPNYTFYEFMQYNKRGASIGVDLSGEIVPIGQLKMKLSGDTPIVNFYNNAYGYGALVEELEIDANSIDRKFGGIEKVKTTIEQTKSGLTTWVYGYENGKYYLIGTTKQGVPLELPDKIYIKNKKNWVSHGCNLITILDGADFESYLTWSLSKNVVKVESDTVEFKVEPSPLEFAAEGGTQKLTVTTNLPKFKSVPDEESKRDGWLKISEVDGGVDVTTTPNTEPKERKGYVIVTPINAAGKALENKVVTIPVTQKPSFLVNVEPNPITLSGYGSEFKNGKMTKSFTVKYIKDAKSVNVRVEFEQDDKDNSWLTLDGDWASQTSDDMLFICKRNFTVTPNTSFTKSRSAKIIVELTMPDGSKPDPEIVPVTQEPMKGELTIAPNQLLLKAEEYAGAEFSDRQEVTINTNLLDEAIEKFVFKEEKLSPSKGWLKYEHKEKSKTIVIYADAYPEEKTPRDGIIYYTIVTTDGKEFPASVKVKQQGRGAGALFTINPSTIRFEAKASEMLVKVEGENVEGISSFDVQWPSWLGGAHSTLSKTLSLTATQNESKEERSKVFTLTVKMKNGDLVSRQFVAYQDGANDDEDPNAPYIAINSSLTFNNKGGSETVQYSTNQPDIAWETNCYWLTVEKISDGLLISAKPNLGNKESTAKIIVYALDKYKNKVADVTINVKQQKGDGYKILVGKYYHESTKSVRDPEQGKYVEIVEWYDELSITESSYTIKHVSNTNPSASYTKTGNLKISKLEVYRLTPAYDESMGITNRDISNWTDYDGYYMGGKFNINGEDGGFTGSYIESSRYGHSYKLFYPIGGGSTHYKISNDPSDPILP